MKPDLKQSTAKNSKDSAVQTIFLVGIVSGTLDILGAILIYCYIFRALTPLQLLQGIAAGAFGKSIVRNEATMACIGLGFHYVIAFCFTAGYFITFPYLPFLNKHKIISGLLYGLFVWLVMNCIVIPLSNVHHYRFNMANALIAATILMLCLGLPISLMINRYYGFNYSK